MGRRRMRDRMKTKRQLIEELADLRRRVAELEASEAEARWRCIVEVVPDPVVVADLKGVITWCNGQAVISTGYSREEIIGSHFSELGFLSARDAPEYSKLVASMLRGDVPGPFEAEWRDEDGGVHTWQVYVSLIREDGRAPGVLGIAKETTEYTDMQERLRRLSQDFAALNSVALTVSSTFDLRDVLRTIQEGVVTLLEEKYPPVFGLLDEARGNFRVELTGAAEEVVNRVNSLLGLSLSGLSFSLSEPQPFVQEALLGGRPYVSSDGSDFLGSRASRKLVKAAQTAMGVKSIAGFPLSVRGKLVGAMVLFSQKESLPAEELKLLSSIAGQAAVAIENSRLYAEVKSRADQLSALYQVHLDVASQLELSTVLETIMQRAIDLLGGDTGGLYLYDCETQELEMVVHRGDHMDFKGIRLALGEGLCGKVAQAGEPLVVSNYAKWEGKSPHFDNGRAYSVLGVPIKRGDAALGALYVADPEDNREFTEGDTRLATMFANQAAIAIENARLYEDVVRELAERQRVEEALQESLDRLSRTLEGTVNALAALSEARDPYTAGHQLRVANLAVAIGEEMGLPEDRIRGLRMAGLIHDIGKIYVPAEILSKPTVLTDLELMMVRTHPRAGYEILEPIEFPWPVADIVLQHHERMNGSGYPQGLSGEEILVEARILGVADVVEAMTSHRPYRPAHALSEAVDEVSCRRGTLYDPEALDACLKVVTEKGFQF
jgi:PAS domain S-box-containing protein/putative nucleotidyltransferase with HDIG domain